MPSAARARPKGGGTDGATLGSDGSIYKINVNQFNFAASCPVTESTADGDDDPVFDSTEFVTTRVAFNGWAVGVASKLIGLANLKAGTSIAVVLQLSATLKWTGSLVLESISGRWNIKAGNVPLAMSGVFTGTVTETNAA